MKQNISRSGANQDAIYIQNARIGHEMQIRILLPNGIRRCRIDDVMVSVFRRGHHDDLRAEIRELAHHALDQGFEK